MRWRTLATGMLAAMVVLAAIGPADAQKRRLAMGCTQSSSSIYAYCVGAAKAINAAAPDLDVSVVETGATVDNMKRMMKDALDYGLVTPEQVYLAWKGEENWKETPFEGMRMMWIFTLSAQYVVVREEAGVRSLPELGGKKFNPGMRGSATEKMIEALFSDIGVKPDWQRMGTSDAVDAMKDKRIVGYVKAGSGFALDASTMDIATQTPIRVLAFSDEDVKRLRATRPHISWVKVPANSVKGHGEFWTIAGLVGFAAPKSVSSDIVYKIVRAISQGLEPQRAAFKGTADDIPKLTVEMSQSPLHAGAIKYFREIGIQIPDRLIPAEAK